MSKKIIEFLTTENVHAVADDLANRLSIFKDYPSIKEWKARMEFPGRAEYDFELSKVDGSMKNDKDANTTISFDLEENSTAKKFLKLMFEEEVEDDEEVQIRAFLILVANNISESYSTMLRDIIRHVVLPDSVPDAIPLHHISIMNIELVDYSSVCEQDRHISRFKKEPVDPEDVGNEPQTDGRLLHQFILSKSNEVNFDADGNPIPIEDMISSYQIARDEIEKGNPIFKGIVGTELGEKYMWDAALSFYVDYSPSQKYVSVNKVT